MAGDPAAGAHAPALRIGDLRRGRLDARAHPRHGCPPVAQHRSGPRGASHLRRRDAGGGRSGGARLQGDRRAPRGGPARRPAGGCRRQIRAPSRRLCQRGGAGGGLEAHWRLRDLGRRLPGEAPRQPDGGGRSRQPQGQGGCGRHPRHHPVLLRQRPLPAVPGGSPRARHLGADRAGHRADPRFQARGRLRRPLRRQHAGVARPPLRRARSGPGDDASGGRRRRRRAGDGPGRSRHPTVPLLHPQPRRPGLRHLPPAGAEAGAGGAHKEAVNA